VLPPFNDATVPVASVQNVIASHESNGLDIIIALLLSDINPLRKQRIDLVLQLKVATEFSSSASLMYVMRVMVWLVLWHCDRSSVFDRRTFPVLHLTCS